MRILPSILILILLGLWSCQNSFHTRKYTKGVYIPPRAERLKVDVDRSERDHAKESYTNTEKRSEHKSLETADPPPAETKDPVPEIESSRQNTRPLYAQSKAQKSQAEEGPSDWDSLVSIANRRKRVYNIVHFSGMGMAIGGALLLGIATPVGIALMIIGGLAALATLILTIINLRTMKTLEPDKARRKEVFRFGRVVILADIGFGILFCAVFLAVLIILSR